MLPAAESTSTASKLLAVGAGIWLTLGFFIGLQIQFEMLSYVFFFILVPIPFGFSALFIYRGLEFFWLGKHNKVQRTADTIPTISVELSRGQSNKAFELPSYSQVMQHSRAPSYS